MRALILTTTAALVLGLGLAPQTASAAWAYKTVSRFDPACNRYVTHTERVWVSDLVTVPPVVTYSPPPVVVTPPVVVEPAPVVVYPEYYYSHYHHYYDHYHHYHH